MVICKLFMSFDFGHVQLSIKLNRQSLSYKLLYSIFLFYLISFLIIYSFTIYFVKSHYKIKKYVLTKLNNKPHVCFHIIEADSTQ